MSSCPNRDSESIRTRDHPSSSLMDTSRALKERRQSSHKRASASSTPANPSRRRASGDGQGVQSGGATSASRTHHVVGGFFFEFEPFRRPRRVGVFTACVSHERRRGPGLFVEFEATSDRVRRGRCSAQEAAKDRAHTLTHEDVAFTGNDDVLRDMSAVLDAVRGDSRAGSEYSDDESDGEEMDIGDACRVISVDGESGLGKSRLLREVRAVHANEWKCVEAHADEVSRAGPSPSGCRS